MNSLTWLVILRCVAMLGLIAGAIALMYLERTGWGWLLFIALLITPGFSDNGKSQ